MSEPIGTLRPERLACGDPELDPDHKHLPATYSPHHDVTACLCGIRWWDGQTPSVWKSVELVRPRTDTPETTYAIGSGAVGMADRYERIGWDTYEMRTP